MITLTKRRYKCLDCSKENSDPSCIKDNRTVKTYFTEDSIPSDFVLTKPYGYEVIRDKYDIPCGKRVIQMKCSCGSKNVELIKEDNFENVLNFYGASTQEQWMRGLLDLGKKS